MSGGRDARAWPWASTAVLALIAYVPALLTAPGRMPADSKLYLYLDPGRFLGDAASSFDPRQFAGWVPHQHVAYLWPTGPWYWLFDQAGAPDWIAHRLWLGTLFLAAGLGARAAARRLGLDPSAALAAALVYQLAVYVLPYVSRTSVMLLPWAGLGWIVALTIRATRRPGWSAPAAIALVVFTVGAVNATALAMIVPAPTLWLVHEVWRRTLSWRAALLVAVRTAMLSVAVSLWWIMGLVVQGRYGADVLAYSETLADVSHTATSPEVWRGLGYWLFYVRDPFAPTTTAAYRYLVSTPAIAVSFLVPIAALVAVVYVRWVHRRFAALLIGAGMVLAVGVHPIDDRSPLMMLLTGGGEGGLALALRSSTRAMPVMMLGVALAIGALVAAMRPLRLPDLPVHPHLLVGGVVALLAVANLPGLWTGALVDPALERDSDPPEAWLDAAAALDELGSGSRVLQVPGAEFGAFRWGYTVDQPLPGLTDKPLVTRDLLPLGAPAAMDLLFALDDRLQDGVLEAGALAPIARLLGVDVVWLTNDLAFDRFRTARPELVADLVGGAPGVDATIPFGDPTANVPEVPVPDASSLADPRVGAPIPPVELATLDDPGTIVRASDRTVVYSGSGDGLVDAAAAGVVDGRGETLRASASLDAGLAAELDAAVALVVTDSNRARARHWRSSQDTAGFTEPGGDASGVLGEVASDHRLAVYDRDDPTTQTVAVQRGPVSATATSYGEPFAYLPEYRPYMAIDGDNDTAWIVGEHGDPIGEVLRLRFAEPATKATVPTLYLRQPDRPGDRYISEVTVVARDDDGLLDETRVAIDDGDAVEGHPIAVPDGTTSLDIVIEAVSGGTPFTRSIVAGVGFAEVATGLEPVDEVVLPPSDALDVVADDVPLAVVLTRLRHDPLDAWRDDPEAELVRELTLAGDRTFEVGAEVRVDARADDRALAAAFGWPAFSDARLTGSLRHVGAAAVDGDPATSWVTPFDGALGATLTVTALDGSDAPIGGMTVRQPPTGYSTIVALDVRSGGEERRVDLAPSDGGSAVVFDPPLPPPTPGRPLEISISGIEPVTSVDRRFGDPTELPAAISEVALDGFRDDAVDGPATTRVRFPAADLERYDCVMVGTIDDEPLAVRLSTDGDGWLDGEPLRAEVCDPTVMLEAGTHQVRSERSSEPLTLDRVVLDDRAAATITGAPSPPSTRPTATVVDGGRFERDIDVEGCTSGCWLVFGEGYNDGWTAKVDGAALGDPVLVDGGFNGWWLDGDVVGDDGSAVVEVRWPVQRRFVLAFVATLIAVAACSALVVVGARRSRRDEILGAAHPPDLDGLEGRLGRGDAIATLVVWTLVAALVAGPGWGAIAATGGVVVVVTGRRRIPELVALASLIVVGAAVVIGERADSPPPDGAWPIGFEELHGLGMFAAAALVAGVLVDGRRNAAHRAPPDAATIDVRGEASDDASGASTDEARWRRPAGDAAS